MEELGDKCLASISPRTNLLWFFLFIFSFFLILNSIHINKMFQVLLTLHFLCSWKWSFEIAFWAFPYFTPNLDKKSDLMQWTKSPSKFSIKLEDKEFHYRVSRQLDSLLVQIRLVQHLSSTGWNGCFAIMKWLWISYFFCKNIYNNLLPSLKFHVNLLKKRRKRNIPKIDDFPIFLSCNYHYNLTDMM